MSVQIKGLDALIRKLGKAQAIQTLEKPMTRSLLRIQSRMQEYPPQLSPRQGPARAGASRRSVARLRQPYKRTGTYGKRWVTRMTKAGEGLVGKIGNNVQYSPYVGSAQFQARVHQGRWNTDDQVVKEESGAIVADFAREIDKALAR